MKQLTLIRHAKSSWGDHSISDFDRPLNERGKRDAPEMGLRLASKDVMPDLILSSPAARAKKTANVIAKEIGYESGEIIFEDRLYLADSSDLIHSILDHGMEAGHIMLFGHNPGITYFSNFLANLHIDNVPTCGVVRIEFAFDDWIKIEHVNGTLIEFDYPRNMG